MNWFNWLRLALVIPTTLAVVGLLAVLINDLKDN
jgi:hypothetical protein